MQFHDCYLFYFAFYGLFPFYLEMVLISIIRQTAAKRIPLIKFRRQREEEMAAARSGSVLSGGQKGKSSSSPAAVSSQVQTH